jgi:hypothetical protein
MIRWGGQGAGRAASPMLPNCWGKPWVQLGSVGEGSGTQPGLLWIFKVEIGIFGPSFFCYGSLGRAGGGRGGDPNAPQLFSKLPATIGELFFSLGPFQSKVIDD